ncbi:MAG: DUF3795 domain-containing protein [Methanobacteriaceae archaeon]|nr:DUF3795 domain-containing protein [Methanobacteriaceae archaeon]
MNTSPCGLICEECQFFEENCPGCYKIKWKTFWAQEIMPERVCPIFDCAVNEKKYKNCGSCLELPCDIFNQLKDPNISDEEHKISISERVARLNSKNRTK